MMQEDPVQRERLGDAVGAMQLHDCTVTFRRQATTNDLWCVATGPLGSFAVRIIEDQVLARVLAGRSARGTHGDEQSRRRTRGWQRVQIDADFIVAARARGQRLSLAFLFADGAGFGGAESGFPSLHRPPFLERVQSGLLRRHSNPMRTYSRHD